MKHLKTAWKYIRRSPYQSISAVMIMFLTMLAIGIFSFLSYGSWIVIRHFEAKPEITVFFKDEKAREDIRALETKLKKTGKTAKVKYVSKEEALAIYRELFKNDPILLEMVTAKILPASLEISAVEARYLVDINEIIKKEVNIEEVVYQKDIIENLLLVTTAIRVVGMTLIVYLTLTSILVIITIIGMKIGSRRQEIRIMQLIGARNGYIGAPFVLEGMIYGVFGALLATGVCVGLVYYGGDRVASFFQGVSLFPLPNYLYLVLLGIEVLAGFVIGGFGSLIVIWRYLRN